MTSLPHGKSISAIEVLNISEHGLWLSVHEQEFFLPHDEYPWFRDATIRQIHEVELLHDTHLHWPLLDIDLDIDCIEHPARYPLIARPSGTAPA